jgi:hypothetical protein
MFNITEADEAAKNKVKALYNLQDQVIKEETMGVISMYEQAAIDAGASVHEVSQTMRIARLIRKHQTRNHVPEDGC